MQTFGGEQPASSRMEPQANDEHENPVSVQTVASSSSLSSKANGEGPGKHILCSASLWSLCTR